MEHHGCGVEGARIVGLPAGEEDGDLSFVVSGNHFAAGHGSTGDIESCLIESGDDAFDCGILHSDFCVGDLKFGFGNGHSEFAGDGLELFEVIEGESKHGIYWLDSSGENFVEVHGLLHAEAHDAAGLGIECGLSCWVDLEIDQGFGTA